MNPSPVNSLFLSRLLPSVTQRENVRKWLRSQTCAPSPSLFSQTFGTDLRNAMRPRDLILLKESGVHWVDYWSPDYPEKFRTQEYPPWILFYRGSLPNKMRSLAVVGARNCDTYGREVVQHIVRHMPSQIQVISGLARGIDSIAHEVALRCDHPTYAVLGSSIDCLYPSENESLAKEIIAHGGGVLSEFPPETEPRPHFFPWRNRLIASLADVVWVVQGGKKSGTFHTAKHALNQGRAVAVTPGSIFSELSEGPNALLLQGAHPVCNSQELNLLLETEGRYNDEPSENQNYDLDS